MKRKFKKRKKYFTAKITFIAGFCAVVLLFALIRYAFDIPSPISLLFQPAEEPVTVVEELPKTALLPSQLYGSPKKYNRVKGVYSWDACFPDINDVQLVAAQKNGISPVQSREQLEQLISEHKLVCVAHSPYYTVDKLSHSIPYLVPKAQHLLNTICFNFVDSLLSKGLPLHLPVITSVLRTSDDVSRLQKGNINATTNSCHCYGTTVDITYNRFTPLVGHYDSDIEPLRWSLPMKQVLAEVLNDLRRQGLCYVKHEKKQACFHLTVR